MIAVVLNDGETYTDIDGSRILRIPDDTPDEDIDTYVKDHYEEGLELIVLVTTVKNLLE